MRKESKKAIERLSTFKKYANKWIAITPDEKKIVGSGRTLSKAIAEAKKKGIKNPILTRVNKTDAGYIL